MARDNYIRWAVRQPNGLILPCSCAYTKSEAIERTVSYPRYHGASEHVRREWRRMKRQGWTCVRVYIYSVRTWDENEWGTLCRNYDCKWRRA